MTNSSDSAPPTGIDTTPTQDLPQPSAGSEAVTLDTESLAPARQPGEPSLPVVPGFTLMRPLGAGGMGVVYLAHQHSPRRRGVIGRGIRIESSRRSRTCCGRVGCTCGRPGWKASRPNGKRSGSGC